MSIITNSLSYIHPDKTALFSDISFSVPKGRKAALVGNNGSGKSTLLKIIAGELQQSDGEVVLSEKPYYIPQHTGQYDGCTIAEALGVDRKISALQAIIKGNTSSENFTALDDDWDIEERIKTAFGFWGVGHLKPDQPMRNLSGGEKTKVFLSGIQIYEPQIILLDEPTNHLDAGSRIVLYDFIKSSKHTILCVSHDRTLLNLFDTTLELSNDSITVFGGNYEFYRQEKELQLNALQRQLEDKEKTIKQTVKRSREIAERRQKQESRGKAGTQKKALPRIVANSLGDQAERSSAKIKDVQDDKIKGLSESAAEIKAQIQRQSILRVELKTSSLHRGKVLADAKMINFSYGERRLWDEPLTFLIRSGERICIEGANGSGKTTLVKILTGSLSPDEGDIFIADFQSLYIDQDYSMIDNSLSLVEQVQRFNYRFSDIIDLRYSFGDTPIIRLKVREK